MKSSHLARGCLLYTSHFTEKVIGNMAVDVLDIGAVHFPTGQIFACAPLVELEDTPVSYTHLDVYKRQGCW